MKPLCLAVLLSVGMLGCGKKETPKSELRVDIASGFQIGAAGTETLRLTDAQKIALLRAEAHKRGLRWYVRCFDWEEPDKQFFAAAFDQRAPLHGIYIEQGALPWWAENGPTQADAAYALYLSIQESPNVHPSHQPTAEREHEHKKLCPPELRGE